MKKLFLALVAVFALSMTVNAQNNLGVRVGDFETLGAELSWQHGLGSNQLELDLGWHSGENYAAFSLTGIYQWKGDIASWGFGTLGWYAGVGANLGMWFNDITDDSEFALAIAGQAGLDLRFSFPIQISLDIRPRFEILPNTDFHWSDVAFGIRYCF